MKKLIIATLSTSMFALLAPSASAQQIFLFNSSRYQHDKQAQPVQTQAQKQVRNITVDSQREQIPSAILVELGYQGYFAEQGIPSNGSFNSAIKTGKVDAHKLVQSAIDKGRLPSNSLNDRAYLNAVQSQLLIHNRL